MVITGSPGLKERHNNPLLHHRVRDFRTQYDVFEKLCIAGTDSAGCSGIAADLRTVAALGD